ncbi:MAG: hypothetical protein AVDCRST_MAG56-4433, partial [uncultured Cytophagales bacterium]
EQIKKQAAQPAATHSASTRKNTVRNHPAGRPAGPPQPPAGLFQIGQEAAPGAGRPRRQRRRDQPAARSALPRPAQADHSTGGLPGTGVAPVPPALPPPARVAHDGRGLAVHCQFLGRYPAGSRHVAAHRLQRRPATAEPRASPVREIPRARLPLQSLAAGRHQPGTAVVRRNCRGGQCPPAERVAGHAHQADGLPVPQRPRLVHAHDGPAVRAGSGPGRRRVAGLARGPEPPGRERVPRRRLLDHGDPVPGHGPDAGRHADQRHPRLHRPPAGAGSGVFDEGPHAQRPAPAGGSLAGRAEPAPQPRRDALVHERHPGRRVRRSGPRGQVVPAGGTAVGQRVAGRERRHVPLRVHVRPILFPGSVRHLFAPHRRPGFAGPAAPGDHRGRPAHVPGGAGPGPLQRVAPARTPPHHCPVGRTGRAPAGKVDV